MGSSAGCCVKRDHEAGPLQPHVNRNESWHSIPDAEEAWRLYDFEDYGNVDDLRPESPRGAPQTQGILRRSSTMKKNIRPMTLVREDETEEDPETLAPFAVADVKYSHHVPTLAQGVQHIWTERLNNEACIAEDLRANLQDGFPELDEWTRPDKCRRLLRATEGDVATSTKMLVKAVEVRVRDRQLYNSLVCEITCDLRVIGRDIEKRPVVYMCGQNQRKPLRDCLQQCFLVFEAAYRLSQADEQVRFVLDFRGFSAGLNMDWSAIRRLGDTLGNAFAEVMCSITVVDFSVIAQSIWSFCKPLMAEKTKAKITFVSEKTARDTLKGLLQENTFRRLVSCFDINRDKASTPEDREAHAIRTSICDVPLGSRLHHVEGGADADAQEKSPTPCARLRPMMMRLGSRDIPPGDGEARFSAQATFAPVPANGNKLCEEARPNLNGQWKMVRFEGDYDVFMKAAGVSWVLQKAVRLASYGVNNTFHVINVTGDHVSIDMRTPLAAYTKEFDTNGCEHEYMHPVFKTTRKMRAYWEDVVGRGTLTLEEYTPAAAAGGAITKHPLTKRWLDGASMVVEQTALNGVVVTQYFSKVPAPA